MMTPPLSHDMPCPDCSHQHTYLPCDLCPCSAVTIPGVTFD